MHSYRDSLALKGYVPVTARPTVKRAGDLVITNRETHTVPGRKGQFAGRWS